MINENRIQPPRDEVTDRNKSACDSLPDFTRLRYFHGQMLGANDFQNEQDYFREKLKLLNRCLQGYGTVCGLKVVAVTDDPDCKPLNYDAQVQDYGKQEGREGDQQAVESRLSNVESEYITPGRNRRQPLCVEIECGLALDCEGNELVVRHPLRLDLWHALSEAERHEIDAAGHNEQLRFYLSLCYCVQPIDPVRPVLPDACSAVSECIYSRLRDSVKIKVTTHKPKDENCRDNCCDKCSDKCLLLAAIRVEKGELVIRNDVRRWVTTYEPVTITGINWVHGAENYTVDQAAAVLQDQGLTIKFSRPIRPETVTKGVVDVLVSEGGKGRHGGMYFIDGEISVTPDNRYLLFKDISQETLQNADRVLIIVRTDFILDECCRPVDGNHVGGRVPLLPEFADNAIAQVDRHSANWCVNPPRRYGAWISGNGTPGGTFESWFYISAAPKTTVRPPKEERRYSSDD